MHTVHLHDASFHFCRNCHQLIATSNASLRPGPSEKFPDDWSFIQIGTTGKYQDQPFRVVGHVRLQLRNDYKNFWSCEYKNGEHLWIAESFASFIVFTQSWKRYPGQANALHAGAQIEIGEPKQLWGEYVEKCEAIQYAGELGSWKIFHPKFFLVQAALLNDAAIFLIYNADDIAFLFGEKRTLEELELIDTVTWNEWK